jgi:acyl carrier protein
MVSDQPRNELEQALAAIWIRALGVEAVGIHDSFIALGGHSLIAIEMAVEVSALTGLEVLVSDLMATPTVAGMAEAIARTFAEHAGPEVIAQLAGDDPKKRGL